MGRLCICARLPCIVCIASLGNRGTKDLFNGCIGFLVVSGQIEVDSYLLVISIVSNNILGCPLASPITSYIEKVWALN